MKIIENMGFKNKAGQGEGGKSFKAWLAKTKRGGKYLIKRQSLKALKAWVAKKGGRKILIKRKSLKAWVAKKWEKIDRKNIIESMGCQEGKGGGGKNH